MASHDIDFDVAAAKNWGVEVQMELEAVRQLLQEVTEVCTTIPGENDTIMIGFQTVGNWMSDAWNGLCKGFSQMCSKFGELINRREASINKISTSIDSYKADFHL